MGFWTLGLSNRKVVGHSIIFMLSDILTIFSDLYFGRVIKNHEIATPSNKALLHKCYDSFRIPGVASDRFSGSNYLDLKAAA